MDSREGPLVETFVRLADTLVAEYDVVELTQQLVEACVRLLNATAAGLLLADASGTLQVLASTSEETRLLELLQLEAGDGPCLHAHRTSTPVLIDDLPVTRKRWPAFTQRALTEGYLSVYAIPLRLRADTIGALNIFGATPSALTEEDVRVGQALADIACIGILHHRVLIRSETVNSQLQTALPAGSSSSRPKAFSPNVANSTWNKPSNCFAAMPAPPTNASPTSPAPSSTAPSPPSPTPPGRPDNAGRTPPKTSLLSTRPRGSS